ncbi:hypothetical protein K469DRAFT_717575 [Zopfia rhizophila CBS 207.26]|uniref:Uncharacterized protein n=1 Tax=Zopfia rhizophila CBS 207.26 TaxID=1314779 RepID=A0A6A6DN63_9PEZI|nr:hypothetical protein K469DRAFT_717575 [Zopfia rhizophila CBS 207.26]
MPIQEVNLSSNDNRILNALFDPETLPSSVAKSKDASVIDASLPPLPTYTCSSLSLLENQQNELIGRLLNDSEREMENMWKELDDIVTRQPHYPSAYLNRAMLRRLRLESGQDGKGAGIFRRGNRDREVEMIFRDLSRAIHLSSPPSSTDAVSPFQARILRTAYSHRAYLYLKAAQTLSSHALLSGPGKDGRDVEGSNVGLNGKTKDQLEELASLDFAAAARYGDEVAREMSVRTNPYAKMCGAIVREALREERKGNEGR